jgi:hypothetical protein
MNFLYVLGGIACLVFGGWILIKQLKIFADGKQDEWGFDTKILIGGIGFIISGIALIEKYL